MTLLSALRNGDHRFLPLLLSKIHDVLPKLVNPMLQTQPGSSTNVLCDDIFDGFGNAGIGIPAAPQYTAFNGTENNNFKVEHSENDFNRPNPIVSTFEKRLDDLSSPSVDSHSNPYTSPSIIQSPMEFPGMADFGSFTELNTSQQSLSQQQPLPTSMSMYNHIPNFGENVNNGGRLGGMLQRPEFKRDFDQTMALLRGNNQVRTMMQNNAQNGMQNGMNARRPPLRQNSGSSYGMMPPRGVTDHNQYQQLQRMNSGHDVLTMSMGNGQDMPFR